jgi:adenylylsulfate kinase
MSEEKDVIGTYGACQTVGKASNIAWHHGSVTKKDIQTRRNHKSCIIWFTGLSGSGKSTLANAVNAELFERNVSSYVLDGDNIRHGLNSDLGFSGEF